MRLTRTEPAFAQIERAVKDGVPLYWDNRNERAGDKASSVAVASWITSQFGPITLVESPTGTPFHLADYILPAGLTVEQHDHEWELPGLDCHTPGLGADSLWVLSPYLATIGVHPELQLDYRFTCGGGVPRTNEILFCLLDEIPVPSYNEAREMDLWHARKTIDALRRAGYTVNVIYDKQHEWFPDALNLSMQECVERIARAALAITGDTGFAHVAAAFGTPLVAIYPDWREFCNLEEAVRIAEWWEIPAWNYWKGFYPNAPYSRCRIIPMRTDHAWSVDHLLMLVQALRVGAP